MLVLSADQIRTLAPMSRVIDCLQQAFRTGCQTPPRQIEKMPGGTGERLFLSMPAFHPQGGSSVKVVTFFPDNRERGLPTIHAAIVVFSEAGVPSALLDGSVVTHLRTAAASALASRYLSREDSSSLVIVGTGALAPAMAEAHCTVRPITHVSVCGRSDERAEATAASIRLRVGNHINVRIAGSTEEAIANCDIVSCCTSSPTPVVAGRWLRPGTFVDLVGSFSPSKREIDDDGVLRSRIFVDTFEGALSEAGDLLDPMSRGVISRERIEGQLEDLTLNKVQGRTRSEEITLFNSVGTGVEDFATANLVVAAAGVSS
jgi:ornithine cyclodeaminase/alanine dehydrogenase-like protein (mu-crystallin family)